MLVEKITSRQNPLVKRFRRVRAGTERAHALVEGVRLVEEAIAADVHFETVAFTSALETAERGAALLHALRNVPCRGALVSKQVMEAITDTEAPQGVAAIVSRPYCTLDDLFARKPELLVIADGLQDPGNLGTIIRTAEAAGAAGVITTQHTVDPLNQKAMRASMGAVLRLPVVTGRSRREMVKLCRKHGLRIVGTKTRQSTINETKTEVYTEADLTSPFALFLGSEGGGLSEPALLEADLFIHIPMADRVESLNVATAAAILLYETARQRGFSFNTGRD